MHVALAERPALLLRQAQAADIPVLLEIEQKGFTTDRLSHRSLQHFVESKTSTVLVAEFSGRIAGYSLALFRPGSHVARLYSIAVDPTFGRAGIGRALLAAAERAVLERECFIMRLEVHQANERAARLYRQAGYRKLEERPNYYEDGGAAI